MSELLSAALEYADRGKLKSISDLARHETTAHSKRAPRRNNKR